jgi:hypothetical protein
MAVLTLHLACYSRESVIEFQTRAAEEVARALKGRAALLSSEPRSPYSSDCMKRLYACFDKAQHKRSAYNISNTRPIILSHVEG